MYENSEAGILEIFMTMDINSNSWEQSGRYQSHLFIHMLQELSSGLYEGLFCVCVVIPGYGTL